MAFELEGVVELPEVTVVASYQIHRLGLHPSITVVLTECVRALEPVVTIDAVESDTKFVISAWEGREDLVGVEVVTPDRQVLGTILSLNPLTHVVTLDTPHPNVEVGDELTVQAKNSVGVPTWIRVPRGRTRTLQVYAGTPEGQQLMQQLMVQAHMSIAADIVAALGVEVTEAELQQAVVGTVMQGKSIDHYMTVEAEELERGRREGLYPFLG